MYLKKSIKKILALTGYSININKILKHDEIIETKLHDINEIIINTSKPDIVYLSLLGFEINTRQFDFFLKGYEYAKRLKLERGASFIVSNNRILITIGSLAFNINTWEELLILKEIFIDGIYNFQLASNEKYIFIDIGMNVGISSLFFAINDNIDYVYAYEPFLPTFNSGLENFMLNADLSKKIIAFNYGLGKRERVEQLPYLYEFKGSFGIDGIPEHINLDRSKISMQNVCIKSVIEETIEILNLHKDKKIIAKIDCEGSEYEIIDALFENKLLDKFNAIMMEWHRKGPDLLTEKLIKSSFFVFSTKQSNNIGMIYAVIQKTI